MARRTVASAIMILALAAAACGSNPPAPSASGSSSPSAGDGGAPGESMQVMVYYLVEFGDRTWLAPERHQVPRSEGVARAALEELVHADARDPDHSTPIPRGAQIRDVRIDGETATVDWSAEVLEASAGAEGEALGIQEVVWTLTEFPTVRRVSFTVEGKTSGEASNGREIADWWGHVGLTRQPFTRDEAIEVLEPITLWEPLDGDGVGAEIRVEGEASTFEANVAFRLFDASGKQVLVTSTTASEGAPGRGTFSSTIGIPNPPSEAETWRLEAYESSAEDGSDSFVESRSITVGGS